MLKRLVSSFDFWVEVLQDIWKLRHIVASYALTSSTHMQYSGCVKIKHHFPFFEGYSGVKSKALLSEFYWIEIRNCTTIKFSSTVSHIYKYKVQELELL